MALRKISDLPGLSPDNREFSQEGFGNSLLEVSYCLSAGDGEKTYVSRYMTTVDFLSSSYQTVQPAELQLSSIDKKIESLSAQISAVQSVLSGLASEIWQFFPEDSGSYVTKRVYVKS